MFAGQLTGVEGYTESAASGILAGINMCRLLSGKAPVVPPTTTMLGALFRYLKDSDPSRFQPMNSNWGLVDPLGRRVRGKRERRKVLAERAASDFADWIVETGIEATSFEVPAPVGNS
jgi:methylenetetrahydrofolate--tRNA-(uracil-5-)-methyltransferase